MIWQGKQRVATAVFSQHQHNKMALHCFVCLNYHLQYFVLCVWVDNLLDLSLTTSHTCLCSLAVATRTMLQQCRGCNVCVHPDVIVSYMCYFACANNLRSSIGGTYMSVTYVIYGLMTSHLWQIDRRLTLLDYKTFHGSNISWKALYEHFIEILSRFHTTMLHPHCTSPICQLEGQWNIVVKTNILMLRRLKWRSEPTSMKH